MNIGMEWLGYLVIALPYAMAILLGLGIPLIFLGAYNSLSVGLLIICGTWFVDSVTQTKALFQIGLTVFPPDLPFVLIAAVAFMRWSLRDDFPRRHAAWVVMTAVFLGGLALGLAKNGSAAGVQARGDFYGISAASYAMSFRVTNAQLQRMFRLLTAVALMMIGLCVYRWIVYYTPIRELLPPGGSYNADGEIRVIRSNFSLGIAQVLLLGLFFGGGAQPGLRAARLVSPLLLATTLVLQHRSVWLAALVGVFLSLLVARAQRAPLWQQLLLVFVVGGLTAAPLALNQTISTQLQSSAGRALAGEGSVGERFSNWRATLQLWAGDGPVAIAIGRVRGASSLRYVQDQAGNDRAIEYNAHNHYVNTISALGVVGFTAYLWILAYVLRGLFQLSRQADENAPMSALLLVLIGTQLVYYVSYGTDFLQYALLGVSISWVAQHSRRHAPSPRVGASFGQLHAQR